MTSIPGGRARAVGAFKRPGQDGRTFQLSHIELVRWQGRRNRRTGAGISLWTVMLVLFALLGLATTAAQAAGWLHWTGVLALAPATLVVLAVGAQLVSVARAVLAWLGG